MIDRKSLREVAKYTPATSGDHEFIWLQSEAEGAISNEERLWCDDKVWGACSGGDEPTCYVRADIAVDLLDRLDRVEGLLRRAGAAFSPAVGCYEDWFRNVGSSAMYFEEYEAELKTANDLLDEIDGALNDRP